MASHGPEDVNNATFPFLFAVGALENGDRPIIHLLGNGTFLIKDSIRDDIKAVGPPPLRELFEQIVAAQVPIFL